MRAPPISCQGLALWRELSFSPVVSQSICPLELWETPFQLSAVFWTTPIPTHFSDFPATLGQACGSTSSSPTPTQAIFWVFPARSSSLQESPGLEGGCIYFHPFPFLLWVSWGGRTQTSRKLKIEANESHFIRQRSGEPGRKILPLLFHLLSQKSVAGGGCSGLQGSRVCWGG